MQNIKTAVEDGLLLRRDLYSERNLTLFFGGNRIRWDNDNAEPSRIWGYVSSFTGLSELEVLPDGRSVDPLTFRFRLSSEDERGAVAGLWIHFLTDSATRPTFSVIEELFGKDWIYEEVARSTHRPYSVATVPHGNQRILYYSNLGGRSTELRFDCAFDGRLEIVSIWMKGLLR